MLDNFLVQVHDSAYATAIREGSYLFPWIESVHVLALTAVVGSISVVDLRLLGLASMSRSISSLTRDVLPITWTAFAAAVITGASLFSSHAIGYAENFEFRAKMLLLVLAGLNMMSFHWIMRRGNANLSDVGVTPWQGKIAGALSLALWIAIVAFGRWIGFSNVA